ncbi:melanoma inhibitory activity protein 2-like [Dasypus novemcinctus]|uniref:melanoma inhibitory activity protein 2-like n=1 Tax=Dasypus novemcinctus TaxID=9361 RepID=UPI0039C8F961
MQGLLIATKVCLQLLLEQLGGTLLMFSQSLRQLPVLLGFPGVFLVCTVTVMLIVKCLHTVRRHNELVRNILAATEKLHQVCEKTTLRTTANGAVESSVVGDEPKTLLTLCLSAVNQHLNNSSLEDNMDDHLENDQQSRRPQLLSHGMIMARLQEQIQSLKTAAQSLQSFMMDTKKTLEASQVNGEQFQKKRSYCVKENIHLQENLPIMAQNMEGWKEREQEMREQIQVVDDSKGNRKEALQEKDRHIESHSETLLKMTVIPDHVKATYAGDDNMELEKKRESENGEHLVYPPAIDGNKLNDVVNLNVSSKRLDREELKAFNKVCEEAGRIEEMTGHIKSLRNQQASLYTENSHLEKKIEKLQMKLQILSEVQQKHLLQLERRAMEEGSYHTETEKKLRDIYGKMNFMNQKRNLCKKMAEDMEKEMDRTNSFFHNQIMFYEKLAQERGLKALSTERKLKELRKENDSIKEILARIQLKPQVSPSRPLAPEVQTATFSLKV